MNEGRAKETPSYRGQIRASHAAATILCWYGSSHMQSSEAHEDFCWPPPRWRFPRQQPRLATGTRTRARIHTWFRISVTKLSLRVIWLGDLRQSSETRGKLSAAASRGSGCGLLRAGSSLSGRRICRVISGLIWRKRAEVSFKRARVHRDARRYSLRVCCH